MCEYETLLQTDRRAKVNCLTQSSAPVLLDDGHGQNVAEALATGPSSDFISAASYTQPGGAGLYSAYVGAVLDLVRIVSLMHTAQYQYIPGIRSSALAGSAGGSSFRLRTSGASPRRSCVRYRLVESALGAGVGGGVDLE